MVVLWFGGRGARGETGAEPRSKVATPDRHTEAGRGAGGGQ